MNNTQDDEGIETSVLDINWIASLKKKVSDTKFRDRNREPTIFRVPDILKSVDPQAYEPSIVSLGPYHRDKPHLQAMNEVKWKYLKYLLQMNPHVALEDYVDLIKKLETRARNAYSEEVEMDSKSFVEMMLLDGCFLMLTIMEWNTDIENSESPEMKITEESTLWTHFGALQDIFVLENQLPFFLLETLYDSAFPRSFPFRNLTLEFIRMHTKSNLELRSNNETCHHIIHLFLSCIDPTTNHGNGNGNQSSTFNSISKLLNTVSLPSNLSSSSLSLVNKKRTVRDANPIHGPYLQWIPSAIVFSEAGIRFKRKVRYNNFLDITFHDGKLEIPQFQIHDHTNTLWRNLIAYEQCSRDSKFHVTSYVMFMDYLIDTVADVELLQRHDIIIGDIGDGEKIATLFNELARYVCFKRNDFYLGDVINAMRKHRDTRSSAWRERLNHDYFSNPWTIVSLFNALVLLVLTVTQTVYAVASYFRSSN